jgi:GT2 family glycosyltransferase
MRILLTNHQLDCFAGTELFVRDLAKELKFRGHNVSVFSPVLGMVAREIEQCGVVVTDDLLTIQQEQFDVIHAQHNNTAALVRAVFPNTPMVFMSHGVLPELEQPPKVDLGIEKFIAVSEEVAKNIGQSGIAQEKIEIVRNFVDAEKFRPIRPIGEHPVRLMVLSNHYESQVREVIEGACQERNIDVSHVGLPDNPVADVSGLINDFDVVVTLGRGVIESMAAGRNVIIFDIHGGDGFVDQENYFENRKYNFSGRRNGEKYDRISFGHELDKYDSSLGLKLREIAVNEHSLNGVVLKLEGIYSMVSSMQCDREMWKPDVFQSMLAYYRLRIKKRIPRVFFQALAPLFRILAEQKARKRLGRVSKGAQILRRVSLVKIIDLFKKSKFVVKKYGVAVFLKYAVKFALHGREYFQERKNTIGEYQKWIAKKERGGRSDSVIGSSTLLYMPKISIIIPVYDVEPELLDACIQSVLDQSYEIWELCLHDDASTKKETIKCLRRWEGKDARIKITYGVENQHISLSSNEAIKLATGKFIALLDNDDLLASDALFENVKLLNAHKHADLIYSDEDKLSADGIRKDPFFKPDWSPDLLLSMNYISHLGVYRKSIVDAIGGFRQGFEGAQDYDLILRFIEKTKAENIFHIPKILYHWRETDGSTSTGVGKKNYAIENSIRALREYLERNEIAGSVEGAITPGRFRVKRDIIGNPLVSIIIPFRDQQGVLRRCLESIKKKTTYLNYEIILIDNQSQEESMKKYLTVLERDPQIKVLYYDLPFNFSAINNFAVAHASGEYVLFLNNDMEVISQNWLEAMLEHIQRKEVGAVGAKLLYFNDTVQHAGVIVGLGIAGHAFRHFRRESDGYFSSLNVVRNYSAVTGACLMTRKELFLRQGGFNEKELGVAYNDVDYCLRLREDGYLIVYTPYAELYHHESLSRGDDAALRIADKGKYERVISEREYMADKWASCIENDPYHNPNLTKLSENFGIRLE